MDFFLLIQVGAIIIALVAALRKFLADGKQPAGRDAPPRRVAAQPRQPVGGDDAVIDEIEQFLKRAAQQRGQGRAPGVELIDPNEPALLAEQPVDAIVIEEVADRHTVADSVSRHLDTSDISQHVGQLGDRVEMADEKMAAHLSEAFDHRLGRLSKTTRSEEDPYSTDLSSAELSGSRTSKGTVRSASVGFAASLCQIGNMRQAIIASEILKRPEERWND